MSDYHAGWKDGKIEMGLVPGKPRIVPAASGRFEAFRFSGENDAIPRTTQTPVVAEKAA